MLRAQKYGGDDLKFVNEAAKEIWIKKFDRKNWNLDGKFSMDSVMAIESLSHLVSTNSGYDSLLKPSFESLEAESLYLGQTQAFYMAKESEIDTLEMNMHIQRAITTYSQFQELTVPKEKMRNYFMTKVKLADSVRDVYHSLKGLEMTPVPYLKQVDNTAVKVVDFLGRAAAFEIEKVQLVKEGETFERKFEAVNNVAKLDLKGLDAGRYQCQAITKSGAKLKATEFFNVEQSMEFSDVHYGLVSNIIHEPKQKAKFPKQISFEETAEDGSWIHLTVSAEGMDQVYLSMKKTDYMIEHQQAVNSYAVDGKIAFPIDSLNLVNGQYSMTLVGTSATGKTLRWELGTVNVWFKEGQHDTTNNHIPSQFIEKPELKASFPAPDF